MDPKQLRQIIKEEVTDVVKTQLKPVNEKLERVENKVDALAADVMDLQDQTKAIWDKISLVDDRNKRGINEVKQYLGMPIPAE